MTWRRAPLLLACALAATLTACASGPSASVGTTQNNPTASATPSTSDRLMAEAQRFAYRVRNVDCSATGSSFAIAQGIVTNRHVASGAQSLQLSTWSGTDFDARVQSISEMPGPDLAILSSGSSSSPAILNAKNPPAGTQVWAAGYPEGDQLSLIPGVVLDYIDGTVYGVPGLVMELTNAVKPGNSGSPLLASDGKVVGVVFAGNTVTGNGLAIPVTALSQFLAAPGTNTYGGCIG